MLDVRLLLLLLVLVIIVLAALPPVRSSLRRASAGLRRRPAQRPPSTGVTIISASGDEFEVPDEAPTSGPEWGSQLQMLLRSRRLLAVLFIILVAVLALQRLPRVVSPDRTDQLVVLVAPFRELDGSVGQTGRSVAEQLVATMQESGDRRVVARTIADPPADTNAALALMQREGADALVWGNVTRGGMLNEPSLLPLLTYRPSGAFAPAGWDGYTGRFAMPDSYVLANAPIIGRAVLPRLLGALADYDAGRADPAFTTFGELAESGDYPGFASALPYALRGNIFWARGEYAEAAGEYLRAENLEAERQAAGDQQGRGVVFDPRALLANNRGAILQDAGDPAARDDFARSVKLLNGQDLGALRYNLGIEALRAGQAADAVSALEQAQRLLPPSTPLLLALSEGYRANAQFDQAQATINAALQQVNADTTATTSDLRDMAGNRLRAAAQEQRGLLRLAQILNARGPLLWELQASTPLPQAPLGDIANDLVQAVGQTDILAQGWTRRSTAEDAAHRPIGGLLAMGQAQRADQQLRERQRWLAAVQVEQARAGGPSPQGIAALWASLIRDRTPLGQGIRHLNDLLQVDPKDVEAKVLLGRALRTSGDHTAARAQFDAAADMAPRRPEPVYEQALEQLPDNSTAAGQLLSKAIMIDDRYFPARQQLAELAEAAGDWPTAIAQRRWLEQQRPSDANALVLAETLHRSGRAGYAEAEHVLLPLASANNVKALMALAQLYQDYGDLPAARDVLERAQRAAPNDPDVAYEQGQVLAAQGDTNGARAQFERALALQPRHVPAHLALAQLSTDSQQATQQYQAALASGANDPVALKRIGAVLLANGEAQNAVVAYERAIAAASNDPETHHGLARAYLERNRPADSEREERTALDLKHGIYPEALAGLGDIALQRGNLQDAVQQYNAALQQNGKLTAAYIGLGRAAAAADNWSVAQGHFRNAIAQDGNSAEAYLWLGEALIRQGDTSGAIDAYSRAIALRQDYPEAYFGLAQAQLAAGKTADAATNLDKALAQRPNYAEALLLQGKLYEQIGDDDHAISSYSKAIAANGQLAEPHYRRALLRIRQNNMSDAESDLAAATRLQPNFSEGHYWLGRTYLAEGRALAARDEFVQAIGQREGNYADAYFYRGLAEEQLGQREEAAASFKSAIEQGRDSAWADEAQAALARLGQP